MTRCGFRWRRRAALAVFLPAIFLLGCKQADQPPDEKVPPATVKWEGPSQLALEEWTELVGTTMPLPGHIARVTAPVEGRVISVLTGADGKSVTEGQQVAKGTVLVKLDDTLIRANLAKLEATEEVLRQEEMQARYAVELATVDVERLRRLKEDEDRRGRVSPAGSAVALVSEVDRQKAQIALKDAQCKLQAARGRQAAGARDIEAIKEQLRFYTLTAPINGRLGRIQVVPGQTLTIGTPVAEIVDLDEQIDALSFVPASMVRRLQVGQPACSGGVERDPNASVEVEAEGRVEYIAEQAEPETGNFAVKIRFANKEARLRANRVLRLRVLTTPSKECLSLPEAAVMEDEEPPTVVIVENIKTEKNAEGKEETTGVARRLQAELGIRDRSNHQVEIIRLIDPEKDPAKKWQGDIKDAQFVVEGGAGLQTGDAVKLEVEND
jgi:multidrug efflux pump subunit AcrA (membrane-fusion protein)